MTLHSRVSAWHSGEAALQKLLHVPHMDNPTSVGLPSNYAYRVLVSPLVAFGALDTQGRPWTTVWGGEPGFARPIEGAVSGSGSRSLGVLSANSLVDARYDPVLEGLFGGGPAMTQNRTGEYQITREELEGGRGKIMSGLSIDLATRDRVKLSGRLLAGRIVSAEEEEGAEAQVDPVARVQMAMLVEESLGNCPKYLNKKAIRPHPPSPRLISDTLPLPPEALDLLAKADLFFLSSTNGDAMDTNHRGGPPGFVRVVSNNHEDGVTLCYPEYSGNRLYQTLGNLHVQPLVGVVVPDFATGDALHLTGETKILVGADAARVLPHTKLAVRVRVTAARFVAGGLPFRGDVVDYSPYNPPLRRLAAEVAGNNHDGGGGDVDPASQPPATATLVQRDIITPVIARFTFTLKKTKGRPRPLKKWNPGQHVTFDFSSELDMGYSHMRDDDPRSLNDDFVRTFTISNLPPSAGSGGDDDDDEVEDGTRLEITAKKHGPATGLLWAHNLRVPLEVPVLGFGGEESFRISNHHDVEADSEGRDEGKRKKKQVFIAGGVGITPLLAQAPELVASGVDYELLWSLRGEDLPLAEDTFTRIPGLSTRTRIFVTGKSGDEGVLDRLRGLGSSVSRGRLTREDLRGDETGAGRKYYMCTGSEMVKTLLGWLEGEDVVYETFEY